MLKNIIYWLLFYFSSEDLLSLVEEEKLTRDNVVVLTFLFEGLCQLGSDSEGRELLLKYRAHIPLGQYLLQGLNQLHQTDENTQVSNGCYHLAFFPFTLFYSFEKTKDHSIHRF